MAYLQICHWFLVKGKLNATEQNNLPMCKTFQDSKSTNDLMSVTCILGEIVIMRKLILFFNICRIPHP